MYRVFHILLAVSVWSLPAFGDVIGPGGRTIDCFCTDKSGGRIELGQTICLQVDGQMFMAQCQMSLNVPMWRKVQDGCMIGDLDQGGMGISVPDTKAEI